MCGDDRYSGKNFDYRREWIVGKINQLSRIFLIEICAYAVMSNHYHLVLRINAGGAAALSDGEVVERWRELFRGHLLVDRWKSGESMTGAELAVVKELIEAWRERLSDLSWFMRCLNEGIARRANEEDGCKGRFWEGRFKSQALLDDAALLSCMAYVDLNPIRAGLSETPEQSDYTSISERIRQWRNEGTYSEARDVTQSERGNEGTMIQGEGEGAESPTPVVMTPFVGSHKDEHAAGIPFSFTDYITLMDWTGRAIRDDKRGAIPAHIAPVLERLGIEEKQWLPTVKHFGSRFCWAAGCVESLREFSRSVGASWLKGMGRDRRLGVAVS